MVVSWSCLFSKHTAILTPLSQGYPAAQGSFCTDLPPVTAPISCSLCLTFPWPKAATEEFHSCSSLLFHNVPYIYFSNALTEPAYMVSHSLTSLRKAMISGDLPKIKEEDGIKVVSSFYNMLFYVALFQRMTRVRLLKT